MLFLIFALDMHNMLWFHLIKPTKYCILCYYLSNEIR